MSCINRRDLTPPQRIGDKDFAPIVHPLEEVLALANAVKKPLGQVLGALNIPQGPGAIAIGMATVVKCVGVLPDESENDPVLGDPAVLGAWGSAPRRR